MLNVFEQVSANKTKSVIVIAGFVGFVSLVFYLITYTLNLDYSVMVTAIFFSLISSLASYYWGDKFVLALNGAKVAIKADFFDYYSATENLAIASQIPLPKMYIIDSPALNAFATGRDPDHATICVTTGLLQKLNRTQLEGVIAHELSHVNNYDIRLTMLVSLLVGSLSILSDMILHNRLHLGNRDNQKSGAGLLAIFGLILLIFSPLIAQLIQLAISRRREFLADASGVKLTRQPSGLIEALEIISQDTNQLTTASPATASLYITNPFKGKKIASLFSTHPPIEDRIAALKQMF